jgi:hypothetical protein
MKDSSLLIVAVRLDLGPFHFHRGGLCNTRRVCTDMSRTIFCFNIFQKSNDQLRTSSSLQAKYGADFVKAISEVELLCNAATALIAPDMYDVGLLGIRKIKEGTEMARNYDHVHLWPSVFGALEVIVNRKTPPHRDPGGAPSHFDLLVAAGTHTHCFFELCELKVSFEYLPGAIILVCGRKLFHAARSWEGGERICIAHFTKESVHTLLEVPLPSFPNYSNYESLFG